MPKMVTCSVCGKEVPEEDSYECIQCGEITCNSASCGDGSLCMNCIGDDVFLADILDLE